MHVRSCLSTFAAAAACLLGVGTAQGSEETNLFVSFDGDTFAFNNDIAVAGYDHKLMEAVDALVSADFSGTITDLQTTINIVQASVSDAQYSMATYAVDVEQEVIELTTNVYVQVAGASPYRSSSAHNCTQGGTCPCLPVNPCADGAWCTAQGAVSFTCGTPTVFPSSVPAFNTDNISPFQKAGPQLTTKPAEMDLSSTEYHWFGKHTHLNHDGTKLYMSSAKGGRGDGSMDGSLYYFSRPSREVTDWTLVQIMRDPAMTTASRFGNGFVVSSDDSTIIARDHPDLAVLHLNATTGLYDLKELVYPDAGTSSYDWSFTISADSNIFVAGLPSKTVNMENIAGFVRVFERPTRDDLFVLTETIYPPVQHMHSSVYFGQFVYMSEDCSVLMVLTQDGSAGETSEIYIYSRANATAPFAYTQSIFPPMTDLRLAERVYLGDMSPAGDAIVLASVFEGAHWVYLRNQTSGVFQLAHHVEQVDQMYGGAVAINADYTVWVTAQTHDIPCTRSGAAFVYKRVEGTTEWFVEQEIMAQEAEDCILNVEWGNVAATSGDGKTFILGNYETDDERGDFNGVNQMFQRP